MPRRNRLTDQNEAFYHITTRVVDKRFRFTDEENARNVALMRRAERFSGVEVLSYCFMSNHIHLLLRVPRREEISEAELLNRIEVLYGTVYRRKTEKRWKECREYGYHSIVSRDQASYLRRMYDMGEFMKTFKQRLSVSYNGRNGREGTLWEDRYHSVLLQPVTAVLRAVSAYIDLNPVRAKMVGDPNAYAFSSYGAACAGDEKAREGLCHIVRDASKPVDWKSFSPTYRLRLVLKPKSLDPVEPLSREELQEAIYHRGKRGLVHALHTKCRFFSKGFALGTEAYVQSARRYLVRKYDLFPHRE